MSYGDYVEQLTFLLFLKMADEQAGRHSKTITHSQRLRLAELAQARRRRVGNALSPSAGDAGKEKGMLGVIFRKAQNKIQDPAKLERLIVDLIDKETVDWAGHRR